MTIWWIFRAFLQKCLLHFSSLLNRFECWKQFEWKDEDQIFLLIPNLDCLGLTVKFSRPVNYSKKITIFRLWTSVMAAYVVEKWCPLFWRLFRRDSEVKHIPKCQKILFYFKITNRKYSFDPKLQIWREICHEKNSVKHFDRFFTILFIKKIQTLNKNYKYFWDPKISRIESNQVRWVSSHKKIA